MIAHLKVTYKVNWVNKAGPNRFVIHASPDLGTALSQRVSFIFIYFTYHNVKQKQKRLPIGIPS